MFPILIRIVPWLIGLVIAGAGAAAAASTVSKYTDRRLVLIGQKRAGKTSWRRFLRDGSIPADWDHTQVTTEETIRLSSYKMKVRVFDHSGSKDAFREWRESCKKADEIFYFVDITQLSDPKYLDRVKGDAKAMSLWLEVDAPRTLAVTHMDQYDLGTSGSEVVDSPVLVELRRLFKARRAVCGSLATVDGATEFTRQALFEPTSSRDGS